jgi:hypothetical protein
MRAALCMGESGFREKSSTRRGPAHTGSANRRRQDCHR